MRISDAKALAAKIVTLELVGGARLTTKIEDVDQDPESGRFYLRTGPLLVFHLQQQHDPKTSKVAFGLVGILPYGVPEMAPQNTNVLALDHIVIAQPAMEKFATLYARETSTMGRVT